MEILYIHKEELAAFVWRLLHSSFLSIKSVYKCVQIFIYGYIFNFKTYFMHPRTYFATHFLSARAVSNLTRAAPLSVFRPVDIWYRNVPFSVDY